MAHNGDKETLVENWLRSLKNQPTAAVLFLLVIAVTGIASFTDSIDKILKFIGERQFGRLNQTDQDARLEQQILGAWVCNAKIPAPTGIIVKNVRNTFLADNSYNSTGTYAFLERDEEKCAAVFRPHPALNS